MYNITLFSSFHKEIGKCNSVELYNIIEKIQPEIIFEELSYSWFNIVYSEGYNPQSLEAITIKNYLKKYNIKHIPVDSFRINESDLFSEYNLISDKSIEYNDIFKQQLSMINQSGYSFLNSNDSTELIDKMHIIEMNTLLEINDYKLIDQYKLESELHDKRDIEMLNNIYNYSKQHQYNRALFICGVEHRKSMIQKITEYERKERINLNWNIYNI